MAIPEIHLKGGERIPIYAEANFRVDGSYEHRTASKEGYQSFTDYFKNIGFCCYPFEMSCEEKRYADFMRFIEYHRQTRTFWIVGVQQPIACCPFCGRHLPEDLSRKWLNLVDAEFGEEYLSPPKMYELPEEWLTDEWWVKRGL